MGQLIIVNAIKRTSNSRVDGFVPNRPFGFDVDDIVTPVREDPDSGYLYFTARQLKGDAPQSRFVGQTRYDTTDTFSDIASQSTSLLLLTVYRRRNVVLSTPETYIFVAGRISENLKENGKTKRTTFFYIEDGDPEPVEYEVNDSLANIVAQTSPPPPPPVDEIIEITYAQAQTMAAASQFITGYHYKITDMADLGVVLLASSNDQLSLEGEGIFLAPDFQAVGDYTGVAAITGVPFNTLQRVWFSTAESGYVNGDVVFWNGLHYQVTDDSSFGGSNPAATPAAYTVLPKLTTTGYAKETDFVLFDFVNGLIMYHVDRRGNRWNPKSSPNFQSGNDNKFNCTILEGATLNDINQRGLLHDNKYAELVEVNLDNTHEGEIGSTEFGGSSVIFANLDVTERIVGCNVRPPHSVTFRRDVTCIDEYITPLGSSFKFDLDMDDAAIFTGSILTIPLDLNYVGAFKLVGNPSMAVNTIFNLPDPFDVDFTVEDGNVQTFVHTLIATATPSQLVSDAAASNVIVGRSDGTDIITYRRQTGTSLNVRTNIVKLA